MIYPGVITYTQRPYDLRVRAAIPVTQLPLKTKSGDADRGIIDQIRCMPKLNDIDIYSESLFKDDIIQLIKLLGSYCKVDPINEIIDNINSIHDTFNNKEAPEIKNWIRILTGLHPELDNWIKRQGYWRMPYSESIGSNTILYHAGPDAIDITYWAKAPPFYTNEVNTSNEIQTSPSYIRESTRHKLNSNVIELIQNANFLTTKCLCRNLIWESYTTTEVDTGNEIVQQRPIEPAVPTINHGVSLNNDWYHQTYRISECKSIAKQNAIDHLSSEGYNVHKLVNHLTPLINDNSAQSASTRLASPLGIEETFPRRSETLTTDVDNSGQRVLASPTGVNNDVLVPEIIENE